MTYGFAGFVGLAYETTWGTPVVPVDFIEAMSEDLSTTIDRFETRNIINGYYQPDDTTGVNHHEGTISFSGFPAAVGYALKGVLGTASTGTIVGSMFTTVFEPQQSDTASTNPLPPFTFEIFRDVTSAHQYAGANISALSFAIAPNQPLAMQATIMAQSQLAKAPATATFPTDPAQPFTFDSASLSVGGSAMTLVENFTLNIDNQLEGVPALDGSTNIARIRRTGPPLVSFSGTIDFLSIDEHNNFLNQTEQALTLAFQRGNSFQLAFSLPRTVYTAFPLGMSGRERLTVGFEGKAQYSTGSGHSMIASLTCSNSF